MTKTPKIIHQVWIGEPAPDFILEAMDTVKNLNRDFEYKLWDNETIKELELEDILEKASKPAFAANIIRIRALKKYGGLYIDADTECIWPLKEWFHSYQEYPLSSNFIQDQFPDVGIIIAKPNIDYHMAEVDYDLQCPIGFYWQRLSPHLIPKSEVGRNGSVLKDLRLNSWVEKDKKD